MGARVQLKSEQGQAFTEYLLMVSVIISFYLLLLQGLKKIKLTEAVMKPLTKEFASAYRYGHPKVVGFEDGGPKNHPRAITSGNDNFRIFINPSLDGSEDGQ